MLQSMLKNATAFFLSYGKFGPNSERFCPVRGGTRAPDKTQVVSGYKPAEMIVASGATSCSWHVRAFTRLSHRRMRANHCRTEAGRLRRAKKTAWSGSSSMVFLPSSWRWVVSLEVPMGLSLFCQSFCWPLFSVLLDVCNGLVLDGFGP